jgi:thiol-disulfide isomerase/thioredoxin
MKKTSLLLVGVALVAALGLVVQRTQRSAAWGRRSGPAGPVAKISTEGMKPAPDLTLKDLDGKTVSLEQFRGKVVLVNFWATWCDPCRTEIPWLIELQQKYGEKGFVVLGVAMDDEGKKAVEPYVLHERFDVNGQKMAMNYPILLGDEDAVDKFSGAFGGMIGLPTSILISRDGKRVRTTIGLLDPEKLERDVLSLL